MTWSSNNLACLNTWSTLFIMKQSQRTFKKSGDIKMKDLLFFNPTLSPALLEKEAKLVATDLDQAFINTCFAAYETGVKKPQAIADMVGILLDKDKTMFDLASIIDDDYAF